MAGKAGLKGQGEVLENRLALPGETTEKEEECRYSGCCKKTPSPGVSSLLTADTLRV